ncbi:regulator of G protein signalling domain-containing protein [Phanerochaete sordida]|uniref:Regulator of G protein signalling domain-containing protein n=1 Tax=Phanerochaete sordida TaxID=48140 RepID=A0A9P3G4K2_9APHY|nr:regulator of G protein signalling domain-containing protein [Phanerochaete sordida]
MRLTFRRPRIRLSAPLSTLSLDDVLSGDTCAPISLPDFDAYLAHREHSAENLRFVVWYQSYRRRFFALPPAQQRRSPGPRAFSFALPSPARTAQHASRVSSRATHDLPSTHASTASASPTLSRTPSAPLPARAYVPAPPEQQPLRAECTLVAATFLVPGAPCELTLPALVLSAILRDLACNTHPDVFLPAYEHAYDALLSTSLPRFLASAEENMNWEKKLYWWLYGALTSAVGWGIVIGCLFIDYWSDKTEGRRRAWRLLGVPFLTLGAMQMYAAYRGFCTQVWGRGNMQLRPWELYAPPSPPPSPSPPTTGSEKKSRRVSLSSVGSLRKGAELVELFECPAVPPAVREDQREYERDSQPGSDPPYPPHLAPASAPNFQPDVQPNVQPGHPSDSDHRPRDPAHDPGPAILELQRTPPRPPALPPLVADGYRDAWDAPSPTLGPRSPLSPTSPTSPTSPSAPSLPHPPPSPHSPRKPSIWRKMRRSKDVEAADAPYAVRAPGLGARARVFGPERVVLDPRIRRAHRRVLRDILSFGALAGTVLAVVVLALPHARGMR